MKVLIVEDNPTDSKLLAAVASMSGCTVQAAPSAEEALLTMKQCLPDVILLDLKLPGMDGFEFLRRVRRNPLTHAVPVIALTAYPARYLAQLHHTDRIEWMFKPIDTRELPARLLQAVGRSPP